MSRLCRGVVAAMAERTPPTLTGRGPPRCTIVKCLTGLLHRAVRGYTRVHRGASRCHYSLCSGAVMTREGGVCPVVLPCIAQITL